MGFSGRKEMMNCDVQIPYYGKRSYLIEAIKSLNGQKLVDINLYLNIFDDQSPQHMDISKYKVTKDIHFNYQINEHNLGLIKNWNKCLDASIHKYVHLLHYDDILSPEFYSKMLHLFTYDSIGMVICKSESVFDNPFVTRYWSGKIRKKEQRKGEITHFKAGDEAIRGLLKESYACSGIVLSKNAVEKVGKFREDLPYSADEEYWYRIAKHFDIVIIDDALIKYRYHRNNYAIKTWIMDDFIGKFIETRFERLKHLSYIKTEDTVCENIRISELFFNISFKLYGKGFNDQSANFEKVAMKLNPEYSTSESYILLKKIKKLPFGKVISKIRNSH